MKFENLSDLRVLVEAARGGSLTAAARALDVTPAAASAMLKRLEAQVGVRLFERSTRALRITAQGGTLLEYAERALELLDEGAGLAQRETGALRGTVRLAAPTDLSRVLLPRLDRFMERHPGVQLALSASDRLHDVRRDAVDLALRYSAELPDSQLVARALHHTRRIACAAPDYLARHGSPQHPSELAAHRCIAMAIAGRREVRWTFERAPGHPPETVGITLRADRSVDDGALAHAWALAGGGIVYKSRLDVQAHLDSGQLVELLPGWLGQAYTVYAVLPSQRFVPARVRALVEFLAEALGEATAHITAAVRHGAPGHQIPQGGNGQALSDAVATKAGSTAA